MQPKSGWERRAKREWTQRWDIYKRYYEVISPLLPASVRRLCYNTLHEAIVESAAQGNGTIAFVLDARKGLGGFRGRRVRLEFAGLRRGFRFDDFPDSAGSMKKLTSQAVPASRST